MSQKNLNNMVQGVRKRKKARRRCRFLFLFFGETAVVFLMFFTILCITSKAGDAPGRQEGAVSAGRPEAGEPVPEGRPEGGEPVSEGHPEAGEPVPEGRPEKGDGVTADRPREEEIVSSGTSGGQGNTDAPGNAEGEAVEKDSYDYSMPVPESTAVDNSYFDDAVFIGDSRTEGLIMSMGLSNTVSYTCKGLMVDTLFTEPVVRKNSKKITVMDALKETDFAKIYIMLGINETGWEYSEVFIESYGKVIDAIREINPRAIIYVQEIMPVSQKVSSTHKYIKNDKIYEYNSLIRKMAEEKQIYLIDTAGAVAGEDGNLPADAATDGIHLKKEYCERWLEYLKTHTVTG